METVNNISELVLLARKQDQRAIVSLYEKTKKKYMVICSHLLRSTRTQGEIEDTLQDAYVKIFMSLDKLENPEKFIAWGARIVSNTALNVLRKDTAIFVEEDTLEQASFAPEFDAMQGNPETMYDRQETSRLVQEMINTLPEEQKACIFLFYMQDLSVKSIAEELQVSENTVKSRLNYGRDKIKTKVLELEKRGTKLYNVAPFTFFLYLYRSYLQQAEQTAVVSDSVLQAVADRIIAACKALTDGTMPSQQMIHKPQEGMSTSAARKMAKGATSATKAASSVIAGKVAGGILVVALLGGGYWYWSDQNAQPVVHDELTETVMEAAETETVETEMTETETTEAETETTEAMTTEVETESKEVVTMEQLQEAGAEVIDEYARLYANGDFEQSLVPLHPDEGASYGCTLLSEKYPNVNPVIFNSPLAPQDYSFGSFDFATEMAHNAIAFHDIDHNGIPEMLFFESCYCYDEGRYKRVCSAGYRANLICCEDGIVVIIQSGGAVYHSYYIFQITEEGNDAKHLYDIVRAGSFETEEVHYSVEYCANGLDAPADPEAYLKGIRPVLSYNYEGGWRSSTSTSLPLL